MTISLIWVAGSTSPRPGRAAAALPVLAGRDACRFARHLKAGTTLEGVYLLASKETRNTKVGSPSSS